MQQRKGPRFKPNGSATVKAWDFGPSLQATILDISQTGMRLRTQMALPRGTLVEIDIDKQVTRGSVCRCESKQGCYEIGVQMLGIAPLLSALKPESAADRPKPAAKAAIHPDHLGSLVEILKREGIGARFRVFLDHETRMKGSQEGIEIDGIGFLPLWEINDPANLALIFRRNFAGIKAKRQSNWEVVEPRLWDQAAKRQNS